MISLIAASPVGVFPPVRSKIPTCPDCIRATNALENFVGLVEVS